jgi:hypothetical protein
VNETIFDGATGNRRAFFSGAWSRGLLRFPRLLRKLPDRDDPAQSQRLRRGKNGGMKTSVFGSFADDL